MKLYTEDQVKKAIKAARENNFGSDFKKWLTKSEESIIKELNPTEIQIMKNDSQQPKPENLNNQFSTTEPLTIAAKIALVKKLESTK